MTASRIDSDALPSSLRAPLGIIAALALLAGLYGRFKGIGTWPLGVDEFYVSRSVDNILRSGLPGFSCGGYYTRGLLYQYVVAGIRLLGSSPEFAGRLVAGLSSLAVLPAAYLLGKRVDGPLVGWLAAILLCVSVWEIEMARFARMYAPFQAVFVWYTVCFLCYTVDRKNAALGWMAGLSVLGVLLWEGGVLLGFANIFAVLMLHDRGRLRASHAWRLAGLSVLVVLLFLATHDLRGFAPVPQGAAPVADQGSHGIVHLAAAFFAPLAPHWRWAGVAGVIPLLLAGASLRWIWAQRVRWLTAAGLCCVLLAGALHLFTLAAGFLVLLLMTGLIGWEELTARAARFFWMTLGALLVFWWVFAVFSAPGSASLAAVVHLLVGFPDVYDGVFRPWLRTLPWLSAGMGIALAVMGWRAVRRRGTAPDTVASLAGLIVFIVLVVGAIPTNRIETRYTFFLYPVLIVLSVAALVALFQTQRVLRRVPMVIAAAIPLLCFAAAEDFQPHHIAAVDSARVNFRVGMSPALAAHFYPRSDLRAAGQWLRSHVQRGDVVISGIPSLDPYYGDFNYFFLSDGDGRYEDYLCRDGRTERWTHHAVLYTLNALDTLLDAGHPVFATVYPETEQVLLAVAPSKGWSVVRVWASVDGNSDVLRIAKQRPSAGL